MIIKMKDELIKLHWPVYWPILRISLSITDSLGRGGREGEGGGLLRTIYGERPQFAAWLNPKASVDPMLAPLPAGILQVARAE